MKQTSEKTKTRLASSMILSVSIFHKDTLRRLKRLIKPGDLILDVGSLNSPYTRLLANEIVAIDIPPSGSFGFSKEVLEYLKCTRNVNPIIASAEAIPLRSRVFQTVICTEVIEHIRNDDKALSELSRVTTKTGKAFLTTPNSNGVPLEMGIVEHFRHYTAEHLNELCSTYFSYVKIERRFRYWHLLSMTFSYWKDWSKSKRKLHLFIAFLLSTGIYSIIYSFERLEPDNDKEYNLIACCTWPK